jgi:hypothetical protein
VVRELKAFYGAIAQNGENSTSIPSSPSQSRNNNNNNNNRLVGGGGFSPLPSSHKLSNSASLQLRTIFLLFPLLGKSICRHLSTSNPLYLSTTKSLQQIYIDIINNLLENKQYDEACYFLQFLDFSQETEDLPGLRDLLQKIVRLALNEQQQIEEMSLLSSTTTTELGGAEVGTNNNNNSNNTNRGMLLKYKIYESFLSGDNSYPLAYYSMLEDKCIRQQDDEQQRIPSPFLVLRSSSSTLAEVVAAGGNKLLRLAELNTASSSSSSPSSSSSSSSISASIESVDSLKIDLFWNRYYNYLRATNKHFVEDTLTRALNLIRVKRFEETALILTPFPAFRPLVILLSWASFDEDITAKELIIKHLWDEKQATDHGGESRIVKACCHLAYRLKMARYCSKHLMVPTRIEEGRERKGTKTTGEEDEAASKTLLQLESDSFLFLLRDSLSAISSEEILTVTNPAPTDGMQTLLEKERDRLLALAYFVLTTNLDLFYRVALLSSGSGNKERVRSSSEVSGGGGSDSGGDGEGLGEQPSAQEIGAVLDITKRYIHLVPDLLCRLALLEVLYSLLFLHTRDLSEDVAIKNGFKTASGNTNSDKSLFIATAPIAKVMLHTLLQSLGTSFLVSEDDSGANSSRQQLPSSNHAWWGSVILKSEVKAEIESLGEEGVERVKILERRANQLYSSIKEALWRLEIVDSMSGSSISTTAAAGTPTTKDGSNGRSRSSSSGFVNQMFASLDTLLVMCLRTGNYERCKSIIAKSSSTNANVVKSSLADTATLAERLSKVAGTMQHDTPDNLSLGESPLSASILLFLFPFLNKKQYLHFFLSFLSSLHFSSCFQRNFFLHSRF